jgi:hypothetical protein
MCSRSWLVFWCAVWLLCSSLGVQAQSSSPISMTPENPYVPALNLSTQLLQQIDFLATNLQALQPRIEALQALSTEQARQISSLSQAISDSQASSLKLQGLLSQSEAIRAMQEQQLKDSTTSLQDSQTALTKATGDSKVLSGWNTFWKVTTGVGILTTIGAVIWALAK